jgi:Na+/melibiose symporter-like transporter
MSSSAWWFAGSLFVAGFADAVVDVAQNVAGVRVQDQANRPILSSMHALWSLGGAASGAASAGAVAAGIAPEWFLAATALISVVLVAYGGWLVQPTLKQNVPPVTQPSEAQSNSQRTPWRAVIGVALPLVVVAVCGTAVEDIANNWAALSGAQLAGMSSAAGVVFAIVIASQCLGRFLGDVLVHRFSRVRVATWGGLCIAAGGCIVVLTHQPAILCAGFATAGWGCATLVPSALNAAARLPGISQQAGVTVVSWLMRIGFLATSPIIGVMADHINLRAGLGLLIPLGLTTALLSQRLAQ